MIRIDVEQGSPEWIKARAGIPTASQFDRILTPKTGKLSAQADAYVYELAAERILGVSLDSASTQFMERGSQLEQGAVAYYELARDVEIDRVGFCMTDDRRAGCSPDGLIGEDGGIEIKCPSAGVHVGYLLGEAGAKYRCQIQGALWVTGRAWWDFLSYNPALPPALVRFERDEAFIAQLEAAVWEFNERLDDAVRRLREMGIGEQDQAA